MGLFGLFVAELLTELEDALDAEALGDAGEQAEG